MMRQGELARMSTYALKAWFQSLLRPLARALAGAGVRANQVTVVAALLSMLVGVVVASRLPDTRAFLLIALWLLVRMALNALDGMLAREFRQESRLGLYLNELGDVVSDVALYLPFAFVPAFSPALVLAVVLLATLSEFAGVLASSIGISRRNDGPMGKSDRACVFGALAVWIGLAPPSGQWADAVIALVAIAMVLTIVNRVRGALRGTA